MNDDRNPLKAEEAHEISCQAHNRTNGLDGEDRKGKRILLPGLIAKEVVIRDGDGKEDEGQFLALLQDLYAELSPQGMLQEMLVERIAVCYWRLVRAAKFEVAHLRNKLDTVKSDSRPRCIWDNEVIDLFEDYDKILRGTMAHIRPHGRNISVLQEGLRLDGDEPIQHDVWVWEYYYRFISEHYITGSMKAHDLDTERFTAEEMSIGEMKAFLQSQGWTDKEFRKYFIEQELKVIERHRKSLKELARRRLNAELRRSRLPGERALVSPKCMERLFRFEILVEQQLYQAMNQLEQLQDHASRSKLPNRSNVDMTANPVPTHASDGP